MGPSELCKKRTESCYQESVLVPFLDWFVSGQYLVQSRNWPFYHPYAIIATFVGSLLLMTTAPIALYSYGYNKYFVSCEYSTLLSRQYPEYSLMSYPVPAYYCIYFISLLKELLDGKTTSTHF